MCEGVATGMRTLRWIPSPTTPSCAGTWAANPHAYTHMLMKTDDSSEFFRPFEQGNTWTVEKVRSINGMNSQSARLVGRANQVFCLDYKATVANVAGQPARGLLTWPKHAAERNGGTLNVLYADGRGAVAKASDIDPAIPENRSCLWSP